MKITSITAVKSGTVVRAPRTRRTETGAQILVLAEAVKKLAPNQELRFVVPGSKKWTKNLVEKRLQKILGTRTITVSDGIDRDVFVVSTVTFE